MRRIHLLSAASAGLAALILASCGGGSSSTGAPATSAGPMVKTASTSLGTVLVDGSGRTLYLFAKDTGPKSTCSGACAGNWPPFTAASLPKAAGGVPSSALALVKRSDGGRQVVIAGHPLYRFTGDQSAGQLNGQGVNAFGARWFTVSPSGKSITAASSSGSSSGGGGYRNGY
jgi:predicted lipoprotein with Yx(FWY)xxD motif